jgi:hypothetical protein
VYIGDDTVVYTSGTTVRTGPLPTTDVSGYVRVTNPVPTQVSPTPPHNTAPAPAKVSPTPRPKVRPTPSRKVSPAPKTGLRLEVPPLPVLPMANPAPQPQIPAVATPLPELPELPMANPAPQLHIPATIPMPKLRTPPKAWHKARAMPQPKAAHMPCHKVPPTPQHHVLTPPQDKAVAAHGATPVSRDKVRPAPKSTESHVTPTQHEKVPPQLGAHCHHRTSTNDGVTTSGPAQCHPTGIPPHLPTT